MDQGEGVVDSCSTAGRVTFSSELLFQPAEFRRRVIVKEMLHLKVPNEALSAVAEGVPVEALIKGKSPSIIAT
jgi:hypothetical protein